MWPLRAVHREEAGGGLGKSTEGQAAHWVGQEPRESQPGRAGSFSPPCQPPGTDRPPEADVSLPQVAGVRRLRGCAQPPDLRLPGLGDLPHHGRLLPRLLQRQGAPLPGAEAQDRVTGLAPGNRTHLTAPRSPPEKPWDLWGDAPRPQSCRLAVLALPQLETSVTSLAWCPAWTDAGGSWVFSRKPELPCGGVALQESSYNCLPHTQKPSPSLQRQFGAWLCGPGCRAQTGSRHEAVLHVHAAIYCTLSTLKYIYGSLHRARLRLRVSGGLRSL